MKRRGRRYFVSESLTVPKETQRTHRVDSNGLVSDIQFPEDGSKAWREVLEILAEQGFEGLAEAMQILINEAMKQ